jgi:hypothetical protein
MAGDNLAVSPVIRSELILETSNWNKVLPEMTHFTTSLSRAPADALALGPILLLVLFMATILSRGQETHHFTERENLAHGNWTSRSVFVWDPNANLMIEIERDTRAIEYY